MTIQRVRRESADPQVDPRYGWVIVALAMLSIAVQTAINYSTGLFLVAITEDTGWSRASVSLAISLYFVGIGLWSPVIGLGMRKLGPRAFMPMMAVLAAVGLFMQSRVQSPVGFGLALLLPVALGNTGQGSLSNFTAIQTWFHRQRGMALGLADSGASLGIVVIIPLVHWLILTTGWRNAYQALALMIIGMAPLHFFLQRNMPLESGDPRTVESLHGPNAVPMLLRSRSFWLIFFGLAAAWFSTQLVVVHQVAYLTDQKFSAQSIDLGFACVGLAGVFGRMAFGWVSDRVGTLRAFVIVVSFMIGGVIGLALAGQTGWMGFIFVYAALFGSSMGVATLMFARQVTDLFGRRGFSTAMGLAYVGACTGGAAGAALAGIVSDCSGSYLSSFAAGAVVAFISLACMWFLTPSYHPAVPDITKA